MCYRDFSLDQFRILCSQWSRKIQLKHENSSFSFHVIYRLTISFDFSLLDLLIRHSKLFFWLKSFLFFSFLTIFWFDMFINIFFCAHLSLLHRLMKKFQQFETRYLFVQLKVVLYILIEFIADKIDKIFDVNWNAKLNDLFTSSKFFFFFELIEHFRIDDDFAIDFWTVFFTDSVFFVVRSKICVDHHFISKRIMTENRFSSEISFSIERR